MSGMKLQPGMRAVAVAALALGMTTPPRLPAEPDERPKRTAKVRFIPHRPPPSGKWDCFCNQPRRRRKPASQRRRSHAKAVAWKGRK